jgi:AAA ATPase domain
MSDAGIRNPFRPGAGHMPPYLAGRQHETEEFERLLRQDVILENLVLTGLRGVGKTVLLDTFKPIAIQRGWLWVGTDLSESTSITEERIALRLITDLSVITSSIAVATQSFKGPGFRPESRSVDVNLDYDFLCDLYTATPGMVADKIKSLLSFTWEQLRKQDCRGVIFAYDEAQNMSVRSEKGEYPLSLLLDTFQSIQKADIPFMLALTGLPTLFPKLVEARTFAERMFHVILLDRLNPRDSRDAIKKPIEDMEHPLSLGTALIQRMIEVSGGYPYFLQFLGREVFDVVIQRLGRMKRPSRRYAVAFDQIVRKLDNDFFAGRWARATDRQRELLIVIASLPHCDGEFTVQDVAEKSKGLLDKPISASQVSQMFAKLAEAGLIYKNRHGRHSFAVPLLGRFIKRQIETGSRE